jgi:SAM-dependent methyltransferase
LSDNKIAKEKKFHNVVFGGDNEARLRANEKFYSITEGIILEYRRVLLSHCLKKDILEYGCGLSSYSFWLAHNGAKSAKGIDISEVAIEQATQRSKDEGLSHKMEFIVMDAERLTFEDNKFDLICGNGIIHHLELNRAYAELARTVRADGHVVFTEPLGHNFLINLYRKLTPGIRTEDEHPLMMKDIRLAEKYFRSVETKYFYLATLAASPFRKHRFFRPLVKCLDAIDRVLFTILPFLKKQAWMAVIVLKDPIK